MPSSSIESLWIKVLILWVESEPKLRINMDWAWYCTPLQTWMELVPEVPGLIEGPGSWSCPKSSMRVGARVKVEEPESMVDYIPVLRHKTLGTYWMLGMDYSIEHEAHGLPFTLLISKRGVRS